jgi:small subunit ribosomal protein S9
MSSDETPRDDSEQIPPAPADEPTESTDAAAEDSVGGHERPSDRELAREQDIVDEPVAESEQLAAEETALPFTPVAESAAAVPPTAGPVPAVEDEEDDEDETPRVKPAIPGMDLEVDIVPEGEEALRRAEEEAAEAEAAEADDEDDLSQPIAEASIDLAAGARYRATGKRKTAVARVILKPGTGAYTINGRTLDVYFPRHTLQRNIRQPLETVGYEDRMDVIATMHGSGVSAQAGALRHGISRALLEADPNLRSELKRRGFLTRDARAKERKKAGLKKARKRPQFSKR